MHRLFQLMQTKFFAVVLLVNFTSPAYAESPMSKRVSELESVVSALQSSVAALQADLAAAKSTIAALQSLKANVAHHHDARYALIGHTHGEYAPVSHNHDGLYAPASLQGSVVTLQNQVAGLNNSVNTLQTSKADVNHHHDARYAPISVMSNVTTLQAQVSGINNSNVMALDPYLNVTTAGGPRVRFAGLNVQIVNGLGNTATVNGTGNLIVGYDETDASRIFRCTIGTNPSTGEPVTNATACSAAGGFWTNAGFKTGSHYIVAGSGNNYSRWGGVVFGYQNASNYDYAGVSGGRRNTASGGVSSVSGGAENIASGNDSSVSGGLNNIASGNDSSVSGGFSNTASGTASSVSGGYNCDPAATIYRWVVGTLAGGCSTTLGN